MRRLRLWVAGGLLVRPINIATEMAARTARAVAGRYIRRSAPTSLTIGITLDVGASVIKNVAARKPIAGRRTRATAVTTRSASKTIAIPAILPSDRARGRP